MADITPALIVSARNKLRGSKGKYGRVRSPTTANRYVSALSHVFTVAINDWEWLEIHPVRKISKLKQPRGRVRFLSDDERERLLEACKDTDNPHLYNIVVTDYFKSVFPYLFLRRINVNSLPWWLFCLEYNL